MILTHAERLSGGRLRSRDHKDGEDSRAFCCVGPVANEPHVSAHVTDGAPGCIRNQLATPFEYGFTTTQRCRPDDEFTVILFIARGL